MALAPVGKTSWGSVVWQCKCNCGSEINVPAARLRSGMTSSCGCLAREGNRLTHGDARKGKVSREWRIWANMKNRCLNPRCKAYPDYGGRGITVCEQWKNSFEEFLRDMGRCPPKLTIERIDNDRNYEPGNCKWATRFEQGENKRNNRYISHQGEARLLPHWAILKGIHVKTLGTRLKRGWSVSRALEQPIQKQQRNRP